ncbi:MAG: inositol monophosphatase family protein [Pseudomonadota bacterium]
MARSALLNVITNAALKAGRSLSRDFGEVQNLQVSVKGPGDFVTSADLRAEKIIKNELETARPGFGFLMEESGETKGREPQNRWIVDPLDGTHNFMHGVPHFCTSIALEREGQIIAGVIYNPATDELFTAEKGQGAFVNDTRMRVSARRELSQTLISTHIPRLGQKNHRLSLNEQAAVMRQTSGVRCTGSTALDLAYVAAGRFDGTWQRGPQAWDCAAGMIVVREAGGYVTDLSGGQKLFETHTVLAGNEHIHRLLGETVRGASKNQ